MSEGHYIDYDDSYPTCLETFSTLRISSDELSPVEITSLLHVAPTRTFRKGDVHGHSRLHRKANGWFYSTKEQSDSRDTRRHIDAILSALDGKIQVIKKLHNSGCKIDITSYWVSSTGQGGPCLMPEQMLKLGALGIPVWWDVYFENEKEI
jgi:hypothetical protein